MRSAVDSVCVGLCFAVDSVCVGVGVVVELVCVVSGLRCIQRFSCGAS